VNVELVDYQFGQASRNRLNEAAIPGLAGAVAALESVYYALNPRDLAALAALWSRNELAQLNTAVGGTVRSMFAGGEIGHYYDRAGSLVPLSMRSTRVLGYDRAAGRWVQVHHHGSLDHPGGLATFQDAAAAAGRPTRPRDGS
jgi:hypothetical protein